MNKKLLEYYNDELSYLRKQGVNFSHAYPKIASRLRLGSHEIEDPFVGRLLESFAFLTARIRHKLDYEINKNIDTIIHLLYPHYLLPIPSFTTIQLHADKEKLESAYLVPAQTTLTSEEFSGTVCRFTTCYDTTLWPLDITHIALTRDTPSALAHNDIKSCLTIELTSIHDTLSMHKISPDTLRFFIKAEPHYVYHLHELFFKHVKQLVIQYAKDKPTLHLPISCIQPVGFSDKEALLPYPPNSFPGYRHLSEYFAYPEKFYYFDLVDLASYIPADCQNTLSLHFLLDYAQPPLEKIVNQQTLLLGCTPIVNIFKQQGEVITVNHTQTEYQVIADNETKQEHLEVYSVTAVTLSSTTDENNTIACLPYFGNKFTQQTEQACLYWHIHKRNCDELGIHHTVGSETFLTISAINAPLLLTQELTLIPDLLCSNRELPTHFPFGNGKPLLTFQNEMHTLVQHIQCLTPFTQPRYRSPDNVNKTDLLAHITLNQMGFDHPQETLSTLKKLLTLYTYDNEHSQYLIHHGLLATHIKRVIAQHPQSLKQGFCHGIEFTLTIDESYFPEQSAYLFGCVIQTFLTKSCSINSFVTLILCSKQRGEIHRWKALLGNKITL